jgi:hypothetical protein
MSRLIILNSLVVDALPKLTCVDVCGVCEKKCYLISNRILLVRTEIDITRQWKHVSTKATIFNFVLILRNKFAKVR